MGLKYITYQTYFTRGPFSVGHLLRPAFPTSHFLLALEGTEVETQQQVCGDLFPWSIECHHTLQTQTVLRVSVYACICICRDVCVKERDRERCGQRQREQRGERKKKD